jgi:ribosome-associated translation inhibitor RaiA
MAKEKEEVQEVITEDDMHIINTAFTAVITNSAHDRNAVAAIVNAENKLKRIINKHNEQTLNKT